MGRNFRDRRFAQDKGSRPVGPRREFLLDKVVAGLALFGVAVAAMQWRCAGPLTLADLVMPIALAVALHWLWRTKSRIALPVLALVFLALAAMSELLNGSGMDGAKEMVQRIEFLLVAPLAFGVFFLMSPWRQAIGWLVWLGALANALVAAVQVYGKGSAATGLFQSPMALSVFLALALAWSAPFIFEKVRERVPASLTMALLSGLTLAMIPSGLVMLVAAVGLLIAARLREDAAAATVKTVALVAVAGLLLALPGNESRRRTLADSCSFFSGGDPKPTYVEAAAACRMANQASPASPWLGIGSNPTRYQKSVGGFYGDLPKDNANKSLETKDTQSGWSLLAVKLGWPALIAFAALLLLGWAATVRQFGHKRGVFRDLAVAGIVSVPVLMVLLVVSDPLVRGTGWLVGLVIAGLWFPIHQPGTRPPGHLRELWVTPLRAVAIGLVLALPILLLALKAVPALINQGLASGASAGTGGTVVQVGSAAWDPAFRLLLQAGTDGKLATRGVPNMPGWARILKKDEIPGASGPVVEIPNVTREDMVEGKEIKITGKPEGIKDPAPAEWGGVVFTVKIPKPMRVKICLRTIWEDGCGNSIYLKTAGMERPVLVGDDGTYGVWHWVSTKSEITLPAGEQQVVLVNREDGVKIDQVLITGDANYEPQEIEDK
jgi:hypothetical protein